MKRRLSSGDADTRKVVQVQQPSSLVHFRTIAIMMTAARLLPKSATEPSSDATSAPPDASLEHTWTQKPYW